MKLNCDIGEGFDGFDAHIMPHIDMANIACGFHASDPVLMNKTIDLAIQHQVSIGAHPSYPDREGFGRRSMDYSLADIHGMVLYQFGALRALCKHKGVKVDYLKPHGALYHRMMAESEVMDTFLDLLASLKENVSLMILSDHNRLFNEEKARARGVDVLFEVFSDRAYGDNGQLIPRSQLGAVLSSNQAITDRVRGLLHNGSLLTISGNELKVKADTLCLHGDNERSVEIAKLCRKLIDRKPGPRSK